MILSCYVPKQGPPLILETGSDEGKFVTIFTFVEGSKSRSEAMKRYKPEQFHHIQHHTSLDEAVGIHMEYVMKLFGSDEDSKDFYKNLKKQHYDLSLEESVRRLLGDTDVSTI